MGTAVMANALDAVGRPGVDGVRAFASGVGNRTKDSRDSAEPV